MDAGRELESRSATVNVLLVALLLLVSTRLFAQAPVVAGDAYVVNAHGLLTVPAASGVLANDTGFNPSTHRLESHDPLSQYGAVITLAPDGSFTYDAPVSFIGRDTFSYTVRNAFGSNTTLVTVDVSGTVVWFVDDSAPAGGDGTFGSPLNSLAPLNGTAGAGDLDSLGHTIFLYEGTYSGVEFDLESGQQLIGHSLGLDLVGTQNDIAAAAAPVLTSSSSFPVIEIFGAGGQIRGLSVQNTAGWGIRSAAAPNSGFTIADVVLAPSGTANGAIELLNSSGTMTLTNVSINGALSALSPAFQMIGISGTMTLTNVDIGGGSGFTGGYVLNVSGNAGTINFDSTSSLTSTNTRGLNIGTQAASGTVTLPAVNIAGGRAGEPLVRLQSNNATSLVNFAGGVVANTTATDSSAFLSDGGRLTIGGTSSTLSSSDGPALYLEAVELTANATFASLSSTSSNARGISIDSPVGVNDVIVTGTSTISNPTTQAIRVNSTAASGFSLEMARLTSSGGTVGIEVNNAAVTVSNSASTLSTSAGPAIVCTSGTTNLAFATLTAAGGANGVSFDGCGGTVTAAAGSLNSTAGASNHVVNITNSTVALTYNGGISKNNAGRAVNIDGLTTPGSVTLTAVGATNASGGVSIQNSSRPLTFSTLLLGDSTNRFTSTPVTLAGNTGAVDLGVFTTFTNGVTALNIAYANASPGLVTTDAGSSLNVAAAATALSVSHATNQPLNLTFDSIINGGAGTHGIDIDRASGTVTVSGETIFGAKTTAGVEISNSNNLFASFDELDISGASGDGVRLSNNTGGGFAILGDGNFVSSHTNGAGGTWTNIGGSAFNIDGARDIRVTDLTINGVGNYGVLGRGIVDLLFSNVDMSNIGNADNEHVFNLQEGQVSGAPVSGNFEVNNSVIENFTDNGVYLENFAGTLNFRWTNNVLRNNIATTACGGGNCNGNGILLRADGTARINAFIQNSAFEDIDGIGLTANPEGSSGARMDLAVASSAFTAEPYGGPGHTNNGETAISLRNQQGNSTLNFRLFSNDITNYTGEQVLGVVEIEGGDFTTTNGVIDVLYVYHAHEGNALQIFADGQNTANAGATTNFTMNVSMNAVNVPAPTPIFGASVVLQNNAAISGSSVNANYIITNSNLLANATGTARQTLTMNMRDFNNACADIRNNIIAAGTGGTQPSVNLSYNGSGTVRLQGMAGSGNANAISYLNANNTLSVAAISGPNNNVSSTTCTTPTLPVAFPFN